MMENDRKTAENVTYYGKKLYHLDAIAKEQTRKELIPDYREDDLSKLQLRVKNSYNRFPN